MDPREKYLAWILRFGGVVTAMAAFAIFLPRDLIASTHAALGLGNFPESPITVYLARSIAALYAMHGGVLLIASTDIRKYSLLVGYLCGAGAVFGAIMTGIDLNAEMPWLWMLFEGPPLVVLYTLAFTLWWQVRGDR